ncbi:hypothetical protein L5515_016328 [Caenorhabditis briggsae]|uniref:Uncharacterized protein n=1 Tax=Caenorhabditis briggsae TaxID=6238 RepID=A0AAE9FAA1_CAEBR|nr:hypothetical protein L5515_016328 [Caenorhabditis briggsae]
MKIDSSSHRNFLDDSCLFLIVINSSFNNNFHPTPLFIRNATSLDSSSHPINFDSSRCHLFCASSILPQPVLIFLTRLSTTPIFTIFFLLKCSGNICGLFTLLPLVL